MAHAGRLRSDADATHAVDHRRPSGNGAARRVAATASGVRTIVPMATLTVRPATPDDLPLILSFVRELADYERAADAVVATKETLGRHLFGEGIGRGPVAECVIGEVDGAAQGFAL